MKLIMENWKRFLNEGIHPKIQKQINKLLELQDVGIVIRNLGLETVFSYMRISKSLTRTELTNYKGPGHGFMEITEAMPAGKDGKCLGGYIVRKIYVDETAGMGPLLYEVALEWASKRSPGLAPDRSIVSAAAQPVWDIYASRDDVFMRQMDADFIDEFDPPLVQLTSDDPDDDCYQAKSVEVAGSETDPTGKTGWVSSPLSKMYYKKNTAVMDALGDRLVDKTGG